MFSQVLPGFFETWVKVGERMEEEMEHIQFRSAFYPCREKISGQSWKRLWHGRDDWFTAEISWVSEKQKKRPCPFFYMPFIA